MGSIKKSLDRFDLGTPLIAGLLGGTADHGEGAKEMERQARELEKANMTRPAPGKRRARGVLT